MNSRRLITRSPRRRERRNLVGASGEPWRHFEAKRFGGRQVDQEFEFGGLIVTLAARDTIPAM
jgi:hypothetical protein